MPGVAQHQHVGAAVGLVGREVGDARRDQRDGGQHQRVVGRGDGGDAADEIGTRVEEVEVVGGVLLAPAQDARQHARVVLLFRSVRSMPRWTAQDSAADSPPLALICGSSASSRSGNVADVRARLAQPGERLLECARHRRLTISSTIVCGTAMRSPSSGKAAGALDRLAGQHGVEHGAAADRRPPADRRNRARARAGTRRSVGTRRAVGLKPTMPHSAAGMRQEPPVSVPRPPQAMASATETAAPEEEPPGMRADARS